MTFTLLYWGGPKPDSRLFHSASLFAPHPLSKIRGIAGGRFAGQFPKKRGEIRKILQGYCPSNTNRLSQAQGRLSSSALLSMTHSL
jgi:hypothetical protein